MPQINQETLSIMNASIEMLNTPVKTRKRKRPEKSILVLNHYGFGNVVMSIPLLRAVCEWAGTRRPIFLLLATRRHYELIAFEGLRVETLYLEDFKSAGALWPLLLRRELASKIDLIIAIPQIPISRLLFMRCLLGVRDTAGEVFTICRPLVSYYARKDYRKNILKSQQELSHALGIKTPLADPSIILRETERQWSARELERRGIDRYKPLIGVHCSASKSSKRWQAENFGKVVASLRENYPAIGVISFGAEYDRADAERACEVAKGTPWLEGAGEWSIRESLAMLSRCDLVLSGDTGIMHMAAAIGSKTLTVFGSTSAERLVPKYNGGRVVVPEKDCYPCYRDKFTDRCQCIREVPTQKVIDEAYIMLSDIQKQSYSEYSEEIVFEH